ncbi:MAG: TRAP transporter TatT component family protein [Spirochaetota bacterium]
MRVPTARVLGLFVPIFLLTFGGCSINQLAVNVLADTLAGGEGGGASVFTTDDDPELVGDALPFALKLYETILAEVPDHEQLLLATGSGFVSYANAFVATPASTLPYDEWDRQEAMQVRAKRLYLRGRSYVVHGLDVRYPGFETALFADDREAVLPYLAEMTEDDVPFLYWIGASWVAAFALDAFDLELAFSVTRAQTIMLRALELDEDYSDGAIHDFLVQYYAGLPESMGGDKAKAEYHFERAVEIADGRLAGPYVSYAEAVVIPSQDVDRFVELMENALAVDPDAYPPARLLNILTQRKARWYLENIEDFFLLDLPEEEWEDL